MKAYLFLYGISNVEYEDLKVDAESTGISASYTMVE